MVENSKQARGLTADNGANIVFGNILESLGVHLVAANQIVVNWTQVHSTTVSFRSAFVNTISHGSRARNSVFSLVGSGS